MGHHVDANALHRTPSNVVVALAHRGNRRAEADVLRLEAPVLKLHRVLRHDHQALALYGHPQVALAVGQDAAHLGRAHVGAEHVDVVVLQSAAAPCNAIQSVSARTYIDIAVSILANGTEQNVLASHAAHVDAVVEHALVLVADDATDTHDEDLAVALGDAYRLAFRLEQLRLSVALHHDDVVVARLPDAAPGVGEYLAEVLVVGLVGIVVGRLYMAVFAHDEGSVARRYGQDAVFAELQQSRDARQNVVGERIVNEASGCFVEAVESSVGAHPQMAFLVAQQGYGHVVAHGVGVAVVVQERFEVIAVVTVQSVVGGYPDTTVFILCQVGNQSA